MSEINKMSEAIKLLRVYSDIKQGAMAEKLGLSSSFLSEMEKGKKIISIETLEKYAEIFQIDVSTIIFFAEQLKKNGNKLKKEIFKSIMQTIKEG